MTQDEKAFVLRDLCARLPYGVKCENHNHVYGKNIFKVTDIRDNGYICGIINNRHYWAVFDPLELKPYLFPMSSLTEEHIKELSELGVSYGEYALHDNIWGLGISVDEAYIFFEFCYKHHIDFLGLIDLGLAIDATGKNIY